MPHKIPILLVQFVRFNMISRFFSNSENVREFAGFRTEWPRKVAKWVEESTVGQDAESQGAQVGYRGDRRNLDYCYVGMIVIESED